MAPVPSVPLAARREPSLQAKGVGGPLEWGNRSALRGFPMGGSEATGTPKLSAWRPSNQVPQIPFWDAERVQNYPVPTRFAGYPSSQAPQRKSMPAPVVDPLSATVGEMGYPPREVRDLSVTHREMPARLRVVASPVPTKSLPEGAVPQGAGSPVYSPAPDPMTAVAADAAGGPAVSLMNVTSPKGGLTSRLSPPGQAVPATPVVPAAAHARRTSPATELPLTHPAEIVLSPTATSSGVSPVQLSTVPTLATPMTATPAQLDTVLGTAVAPAAAQPAAPTYPPGTDPIQVLDMICPMTMGSRAVDPSGEGVGPWELLPDLWIGGSQAATHAPLERLGISAILNVSDVDMQSQARGLQYLHVRVLDHANSDIVSTFWRAKPFLDSVAARRGSVLVHCAFGMNRSASICVAWLMVRNRFTLSQAFQLVFRNRRKPIVMNFSFRQQLVALAKELGQL